MSTMKAVGYKQPGDIARADALMDVTLPVPVATGRDLLVEVRAVSVNPADTKVRADVVNNPNAGDEFKVLGYDASGIVRAVGEDVTLFNVGDKVYYAGSIRSEER